MYIVFEGPECVGKSTQVALLAERLRKDGREVHTTKEPGGDNPISQQIRSLLLNPENKIHNPAALCLFLADRAQNMLAISEALQQNKVIISDRSCLSSFAFYAAGQFEQDPFAVAKEIAPLLDFAQQITPDWCFICTGSYEWSNSQLDKRGIRDRIEQLGENFHRRTHKFFEPMFVGRLLTHMTRGPSKYAFCSSAEKHTKEQICEEIYQKLLPDLT